ncbi:roadblock/LC7 domain-containing protein [Endothiovibrio diazotrophicus]
MTNYLLNEELFVAPTPAGAYYSISSPDPEPARLLLFALMSHERTQQTTRDRLLEWTRLDYVDAAVAVLGHAQSNGWVKAEQASRPIPPGSIESNIPQMLKQLSSKGKAILADQHGFYLAATGFEHDDAETLSALSADVASLHDRHAATLRDTQGILSAAWSVVDAAGNSTIGFWPLFIGQERFSLIIEGIPSLNLPIFSDLIWILSNRYL